MTYAAHLYLVSMGEPRASVLHGLLDLLQTASARAVDTGGAGLNCSHGSGQNAARVLATTEPEAVVVLPGQDGEVPEILQALTAAHKRGALLGSICLGAFDLARCGLLDGRRATTHWMEASRFSDRFPQVHLDTTQILIDDGDILTAGGMMAWTDLGLALVQRFLGPSVMLETARILLTDPAGREQRFYAVFQADLSHGDPSVLSVQHALHAAPEKKWTVAEMARLANLGERTFLRRFKAATGETPVHYLLLVRVARARERLETSITSVAEIAWDLGYSDVNAFRKVFLDLVGLTPSDYRKRFSPRNTKGRGR